MNSAHFEFWRLGGDGSHVGEPVRVTTGRGILLQCHPKCKPSDVMYLVAIARQTPDYPVDITLWEGMGDDRILAWSARIYYRRENYGTM